MDIWTHFTRLEFLNPWSVCNKTVSMKDYISTSNIEIFALAETWLPNDGTASVTINKLLPSHYKMISEPRKNGQRGGGVGVIYKDSLSIKRITGEECKYEQFEMLKCEVTLSRSCKFILLVVYRPGPTSANKLRVSKFWEEWSDMLSGYAASHREVIIVGDLNFHLENKEDRKAMRFTSILEEYGFCQHITLPTRVSGHTVDILITKKESGAVYASDVHDPALPNDEGYTIKDHFAISCTLSLQKPKPIAKVVKTRNFQKMDSAAFREDLANEILAILSRTSELSIDDLVNDYNDTLNALLQKHAPLKDKSVCLRPSNKWYSEELRYEKQLKRRLERKWMNSRLAVHHVLYRKQCAKYNKLLCKTHVTYNSNKVIECQGDRKKLFQLFKQLMGTQKPQSLPTAASDLDLANEMNMFFHNKVKKIQEEIKSEAGPSDTIENRMDSENKNISVLSCFELCTTDEVMKIVKAGPNKQCPLDPLPTWLLKENLNALIPLITVIVNRSLQTAKVPKVLKRGIIRPVLKDQDLDTELKLNYRPVTNLAFLTKVLEKVVNSRIDVHLKENNLFDKYQSAYRPNHSTETSLLHLQSNILEALDKGKVTVLVMLDVSAAFDTVQHVNLIQRYYYRYGFRGDVLAWMKSYLTERFNCVSINDKMSDWIESDCGFPQGSVLGGKKFILFAGPVGDIAESHKVQHSAYADDNNEYVTFTAGNPTEMEASLSNLNSCLSDLVKWMNQNMLKLNNGKTKVIVFAPRKDLEFVRNYELTLGTTKVKPSSEVKNLGVFLDNKLNMEKYVNYITRKAYFHLRNISKVRSVLTYDAACALVNATVTSRLDYCNSLLYGLPQRTIYKLQKVQNYGARLILGLKKFDHITPGLKKLHWLPVYQRIKFKILTLTYKTLNGYAPRYMQDMLCQTPRHRFHLRSVSTKHLIVSRFNFSRRGGRSFRNVSPRLWNQLPFELRICESVFEFKKKLKTLLFREHFGNLDC